MSTLLLLILILWHGIHGKCSAFCVEDRGADNSTTARGTIICHFEVIDRTVLQEHILKLPLDTVKLSITCRHDEKSSFLFEDMFIHLQHMVSLDIKGCAFSYFPRVFGDRNSLRNLSVDLAKNLVVDNQIFDQLRQLEALSFTRCGLTIFPPICPLTSLKYINFSSNHLQNLDVIFSGNCPNQSELTFVQIVDVRNNRIINLFENFSRLLPNLIYLDASENDIENISVGSLSGTHNLQWLDLGNNKIRHLPDYLFSNTQHLNTLILAHNPLQNIPITLVNVGHVYNLLDLSYLNLNNSIWHELIDLNLEELRLEGNELTTIPKTFISNQPNLTHLHLAENEIGTITDGTFSSSEIEYLDLSGNRIVSISVASFRGLTNLVYLNLSANNIEVLETLCFSNMSLLHTLYLSGNRLREVPDLSGLSSLQLIELRHNKITKLHPGHFDGLKKILGISLAYNNISAVPRGVFQNFPELIIVNLKGNSIDYLHEQAFKNSPNLHFIRLDFNEISHISDVFSNVPVKILWLDGNNIKRIENGDLPETITHVTIAMNQLSYLDGEVFSKMSNLIAVDLRYNMFHAFSNSRIFEISPYAASSPAFYLKGNLLICDCKLLWFKLNLELHRNQPMFPDVIGVLCADKANRSITQVSKSEFVCWFDTVFVSNKMYSCPTVCNCSHNQDQSIFNMYCDNRDLQDIPSLPVISSNVYLQNNNISILRKGRFDNLSRLQILDLSGNKIQTLGEEIFGDLHSLATLYLNNNLLSKIGIKTFIGLETLRQLYLQNNGIESISNSTLSNIPHLSHLYINSNNLTSLSTVSFLLLKSKCVLKISDNPWICNCNHMYSFQTLFLKHSQQIIDANDSICLLNTCRSGCDQSTTVVQSYKIATFPLSDICDNRTTIYSNSTTLNISYFEDTSLVVCLTILLFFLIIATVFVVIIVKKLDFIKVYVYASFGWRIFDKRRTLNESGKIYDAFVSYSSKDESFVVHNLAPMLESGEHPYKLCLHYRDFPVGAFIAETIVECIDQSKRTIMVLSNNYLESEWCHLEFKTAHKQMLEDRRNRLIVILLGDIDNDKVDNDIQLYLKTKTYVRYDDPWFWKKIYFALPEVSFKEQVLVSEDAV